MTEKEKQQAGELYDASDRELFTDRVKAKKLCSEFNSLEYNDFQKKERLIDRIVALKGDNVTIESKFLCNYGYNIVIGNNFHADLNCVMIDNAEITFGNNVFIGPNCCFCTAERPIDVETRNSGLERAKPIKVGNNVSFGSGVTVGAGVTIGNNVIIGPGSAVTKDIPSNCIALGNPCLPTKFFGETRHGSADRMSVDAPEAPQKKEAPAKPAGPRHIEVRRVDNPNNGGNGFPDKKK